MRFTQQCLWILFKQIAQQDGFAIDTNARQTFLHVIFPTFVCGARSRGNPIFREMRIARLCTALKQIQTLAALIGSPDAIGRQRNE